MPIVVHLDDITDNNNCICSCLDLNIWRGPLPHGECHAVDDDGVVCVKLVYEHGKPHGPYIDLWPNGTIAAVGQYADGLQHETWTYYNEDGTLCETIRFDRGVQKSRIRQDDPDFDVMKPY